MEFEEELEELERLKTFFNELIDELLTELRGAFGQPQNEQNGNNVDARNLRDVRIGGLGGRPGRGGRPDLHTGHRTGHRGFVAVPTNYFVRIRCLINPIRCFKYRRVFRIHYT